MGKDGLAAMRSTAQKASESKAGSVIKKLIEFINKHFIKAITDNKVVNFVYNKFKDDYDDYWDMELLKEYIDEYEGEE